MICWIFSVLMEPYLKEKPFPSQRYYPYGHAYKVIPHAGIAP